MTTQLRDTQCGHLIRFLSGYKFLHYPDEIDHSLWKQSLQHDTSREAPGIDSHDSRTKADDKDGKDILLVDWYGPDDPEVRYLHQS